MSSWYDPPEEGPGAIAGPDWWVTTYQHNERDEEIVTTLTELLHWQRAGEAGPNPFESIKYLTKEGYEVFIRYGYAWAMEEDADEWLFADSYEDAQGEIGDRYLQEIEDAKEFAAEAAREAQYDRD
tara:strand:+ start:220 stop:597 length:378 start_codon:yes stop_codon:yes gene_type:complete